MKRKLIFMPLSLLSVLALLQFGCDSDEPDDVCEAFTPPQCKTTIEATCRRCRNNIIVPMAKRNGK